MHTHENAKSTDFHTKKMPSQLGLLNTTTDSQQRVKTPHSECPDMTLNNLMVRFQ